MSSIVRVYGLTLSGIAGLLTGKGLDADAFTSFKKRVPRAAFMAKTDQARVSVVVKTRQDVEAVSPPSTG